MLPLWDTVQRRRTAVVTWLVIIATGLVFWWQLNLPQQVMLAVFRDYALVPADLGPTLWLQGQFEWHHLRPLLSSIFLHGGWLHVISNMWILLIFGPSVEDRMGHLGFPLFYLLTGMVAGLVQYAIDPTSTVPVIGASGALAGVLGAYLMLFPGARIITFVPLFGLIPLLIPIPAVIYLGGWFLIQFLQGSAALGAGLDGGVAWWAHVGGFLAGLTLYGLFVGNRNSGRWSANH